MTPIFSKSQQKMKLSNNENSFILHIILLSITVISYLVFPSIQGTLIPLILLPFFVIGAFLRNQPNIGQFLKETIRFTVIYTIYQTIVVVVSMNSHPYDWLASSKLILVNQLETGSRFKTSTVTQSIYLVSGIIFFYLCKNCGREEWKRIASIGAAITSLIGIIEVLMNFVGISSVQIMHNRVFSGSGIINSSPLIQKIEIGGIVIKRLDGLSLEPSMFALTIVPYLYFAYQLKMWKTTGLILLALLLTFSTTAYIGLFGYAFLLFKNRKFGSKTSRVLTYTMIFCLLPFTMGIFHSVYTNLFLNKFSRSNTSGLERSSNFQDTLSFFLEKMSVFEKLFGIGFGTVRSTDLATTLLVNSGVFGFSIFLFIFLKPIIQSDYEIDLSLRVSLFFLLICMLLAVPEFSFLSVWFVLGFAYGSKVQKKNRLSVWVK